MSASEWCWRLVGVQHITGRVFPDHLITGGGWADDLMNDSKYSLLLQQAKGGNFDSMMIAFPCSTFST
jgi:hypothetical protein